MDFTVSSILSGLGSAKPGGEARNSYPGLGNHELAIAALYLKPTRKYGPTIFADAVVVKTDNEQAHKIGSVVTVSFRVSMQSPNGFEQEKEFGNLLVFVNALTGNKRDDNGAAQAAVQSFITNGTARGFMVKCRGYNAKANSPFISYDWKTFDGQSEQTVAQVRQWLDTVAPIQVAAPAPAPQPAAPAQPAPQQWTPPAQTPPPAAPPAQAAPAPAAGGFSLAGIFGGR